MFSIERWMKELSDTFKQHDKRIATVERREETRHDAIAIGGKDVSTNTSYTNQILVLQGGEWTPVYVGSVLNISSFAEGRLSLTTNVPITISVTGATTLYYTRYVGNNIALLNGTVWELHSIAEQSISLAGLTANTNYDVFIYLSSGFPTLAVTAWSSDTARATGISLYDGVYVKTGTITQRYLGTIRVNATGGQVDDNYLVRGVWNMYNRVPRPLYLYDTTSHTYNTGAWRSWNNSTTVRVGFVVGEISTISASVTSLFDPGADNVLSAVAIGLSSTSTPNTYVGTLYNYNIYKVGGGTEGNIPVAAGYYYLQALEYGNATPANHDRVAIKGSVLG